MQTQQAATETCFGVFWCSFSVARCCQRSGQREAVGAERMCLWLDKGKSGMIMLVRESWAYPDRQYGFPACCLLSVTFDTITHTLRSLTESSCCCSGGGLFTVELISLMASNVLEQGAKLLQHVVQKFLLFLISVVFLHSDTDLNSCIGDNKVRLLN